MLCVRAGYLIGCNRANLPVRRMLGLDFKSASFAQDWLMVGLRSTPNPSCHCEFICDHRRSTPRALGHSVAPLECDRTEWQ